MKIFFTILFLLFFNVTPILTYNTITHENLYSKILEYNIKYPDIVFAQAVLESGHFKSVLFRNNNNLFGMKVPKVRKTMALNKTGYSQYKTIDDSIYDYYLFQQHVMRKKEMSRNEYLTYIGKNYAENTEYLKRINYIIKKYSHLFF
jgi:uncharacterized FlgJ-related protein